MTESELGVYLSCVKVSGGVYIVVCLGSQDDRRACDRGRFIANCPGDMVFTTVEEGGRDLLCFPVSQAEMLYESLRNMPQTQLCMAVPQSVLKWLTCNDEMHEEEHKRMVVALHRLPVYALLTESQRGVVRGIVMRGGRGFNCSEMGMGKTIMTITVLAYYGGTSLVVCPATLADNWVAEVRKFTPDIPVRRYRGGHESEEPRGGGGITVISYMKLSRSSCVDARYVSVVLDECHQIKSRVSLRAKAAVKVCRRAKRCMCLSGTPMSKSADLFMPFGALFPTLFPVFTTLDARFPPRAKTAHVHTDARGGSRFGFGDRYCSPTRVCIGRGKFQYKYDGASFPWELHSILRECTWRLRKADMVTPLPKKTRVHLYLEGITCPPALQSRWDALDVKKQAGGGNGEIMTIVRETCAAKRSAVVQYMRNLHQGNAFLKEKFLVFCHFRDTVTALDASFREMSIPHVVITGRTPPNVRQSLVNDFQEDEHIRVAILSISAAGVGLNLFAASQVIFAEMTWNDKEVLQAEDRAHRQGQTRDVTVTYLLLSHSVDEIIWGVIARKQRVAALVVDSVHLPLVALHSRAPKRQRHF